MNHSSPTKQLIADSFFSLLETRSFSKITVRDITNACSMSRQTFYLHFQDKFDLAYWAYKQQNDTIIQQNTQSSWPVVLQRLLSSHQSSRSILHALDRYAKEPLLEQMLKDYTYQTYYSIMVPRHRTEPIQPEVLFSLRFYCHGSADMTYEWIKSGMKESPLYIAEGLMRSMPDFLRYAFLQQGIPLDHSCQAQ